MRSDVQTVVDAAMQEATRQRGMRNHYRNQAELAESGASPSQEVTDSLRRDRDDHERHFTGTLSMLAVILDAAGYDVCEPFPDGSGSSPSNIKAEAVLDKWLA